MSDSNIYMAINAVSLLSITPTSSSLLFPFVSGECRRKYEERLEAGREGRREASAPKAEGGVVVMPSVLPTTSGSDGVLRPAHLWGRKKKGQLNPRKTCTWWSYFEEEDTLRVCVWADLWQWWSKNCSHQASCKPSGIKGQNEDRNSNIHIMNGLFRGESGYNTVHYVQNCEWHAN